MTSTTAVHRAPARHVPERPSTLTLDARPDGPEQGVATRFDGHRAFVPVAVTYGVAWAALSAVYISVGLLLTKVLLAGGRDHWEDTANRWLAGHRTPWLNHVTSVATFVANTEPVVVAAAVTCGVLLVRRRWRYALFLAGALTIEVTVFLSTTFIVHRPRPDVPRLNSTPTTGSWPSGHIAASLILWVGLALIVGALVRNTVVRALAWVVAMVVPLTIGFSRVYRGLHHPTDVIGGALLGAAALLVGIFAARVASAVVERRPVRHLSEWLR